MSDQQKITEFSQSPEQIDSVESVDESDKFGWGSFGKPPDDWPVSRVEELFELQKDSANPKELDSEKLVHLYSMPAFDDGKGPELTEAGDIGSKKFRVPNHTLLFSKLNISKKRFWLVNHSHEGAALCSTEYWPLLPSDGLNLEFYLQYFNSDSFINRPRLSTSSTTNSHQRIKSNLFDKVRLPIPPLSEQRKIASVLYNVDQAIQKTEEIIEQTQQIKTAVVQQAFTEGVFHHDEYVDTKSGRTPANWELVKFESMIEDTRYGTNSKSNTDGDGYPTLRIPNVVEKRVTLEDLKHTPLDDDELERLELEENDILVLRTNGNPDYVGRCATFSEQDEPFVFASYLIRVRVDESRVRPEYIKEFLNSRRGRSEMAGWIRSSAGNYNLSVGAMEKFQVPIPSVEEQDMIVEKIGAAEQAIETNRQYRDKLQRLKQGLMQDLLSGEVRTTDVDIPVHDAVAQHG
ncbi:restriction endonuclease subunit S [Halobacterium salinarum]|uniref:restriction endonuclease subunit S n=1 Tax=Halobacterium salinarum TaxID=2242 RepID=UPI001F2A32C4|nr:restriction endonuclease subunit S [Halobacterium salinarum]MCF2206379.1 restriction endonuclease subunit S [Halobacterium salinarum]